MPGKTNLPRAQDYLQWWHCPTPAADCRWRRRLRRALPPTSFLVLQQRPPLQPRDAAQNEHIEASNQHRRGGEESKILAKPEHLTSQEGGGGGIQPRTAGRSCCTLRVQIRGDGRLERGPRAAPQSTSGLPPPCPWLAIE